MPENDADASAGVRPSPSAAPLPQAEGTNTKQPVDIQAYIGTQLRAVFEDVANQPVPDRFLDLMKQLG